MQSASDLVDEERVVWTCAKNNDGELGKRSAWVRKNGLFTRCNNFDWTGWDSGEKEPLFTLEDIPDIFEKNGDALRQDFLARKIVERGVPKSTAYRWIRKAEESELIKFQKGKNAYVLRT